MQWQLCSEAYISIAYVCFVLARSRVWLDMKAYAVKVKADAEVFAGMVLWIFRKSLLEVLWNTTYIRDCFHLWPCILWTKYKWNIQKTGITLIIHKSLMSRWRDLSKLYSVNSWTDRSHCLSHSIPFFYTELCWTLLLSRPLSLTVSSVGSLYYSSPPLPGYLYQLLQSVCLSALLAASVYTNTDISTCVRSFGLPMSSWPEKASLNESTVEKHMCTLTSMHKGSYILLPHTKIEPLYIYSISIKNVAMPLLITYLMKTVKSLTVFTEK